METIIMIIILASSTIPLICNTQEMTPTLPPTQNLWYMHRNCGLCASRLCTSGAFDACMGYVSRGPALPGVSSMTYASATPAAKKYYTKLLACK